MAVPTPIRDRVRAMMRALFTVNLPAKLLSLVLAVFTWAWIQGEQVVEGQAWALVEYQYPAGLTVAQRPTQRVRVTVSGAQAYVKDLKGAELSISADLGDLGSGTQNVDFVGSEIHGLPENLKVMGLVPNSVQLKLEPVITRKVPLEVSVVGEPAEGYRVAGITLDPPEVELSGPGSILEKLPRLPTEGISVEGLSADTSLPVLLKLGDKTLSVVDGEQTWRALVQVEAITRSRTFTEVPVRSRSPLWQPSEEHAVVTLTGPVRELQGILHESLEVWVVVPEDLALEPFTVRDEPGAAARLEVVHPGGEQIVVSGLAPSQIIVEPVSE